MKKKHKQDKAWTFRPYPQVETKWWQYVAEKDSIHVLNQALNLGLAKFLNMGDTEISELHHEMRFDDPKKKKAHEVEWKGSI